MLSRETGLRRLSRIRPGAPTPAAGMIPARGLPISLIHEVTAETAEETESVEETSQGKNLADGAPPREVTALAPVSSLRSRIATEAPEDMRVRAVARPRPEALGEMVSMVIRS